MILFEAVDTSNLEAGHVIAGLTAVLAAAASLCGGLAALGFTKKETKATATDDCEQRVERMNVEFDRRVEQMMQAFREGADARDA